MYRDETEKKIGEKRKEKQSLSYAYAEQWVNFQDPPTNKGGGCSFKTYTGHLKLYYLLEITFIL